MKDRSIRKRKKKKMTKESKRRGKGKGEEEKKNIEKREIYRRSKKRGR